MKNHPFTVIKRGLQYYPSIFPTAYAILEHVFATNGNGYAPDANGDLVCDDGELKPICITDEGLYWLKYELLTRRGSYHIYPVGSYESELKMWSGRGETFCTDLYHYPKLNKDWQLAARWFLNEIVSRDEKWWKKYFKNKASDPSNRFPPKWEEGFERMMKARKYFLSFMKKFKIQLDYCELMNWEKELIQFLAPERN